MDSVSEKMIAAKPYVKNYWSNGDALLEMVRSGEVNVAMGWDNGGWKLHGENPDIDFVAPKSGALGWIDTFAIPAKAKNVDGAYKWVNFILRPENAAVFSNQEKYATASKDAGKFLESEALVMSDQVAVMNEGRFEQIDTPRNLYSNPASRIVASFVGETNILPVRVLSNSPLKVKTEFGLELFGTRVKDSHEDRLDLFIRPESIILDPAESIEDINLFSLTVHNVLFDGSNTKILATVDRSDFELTVALPQNQQFAHIGKGDTVPAAATPEGNHEEPLPSWSVYLSYAGAALVAAADCCAPYRAAADVIARQGRYGQQRLDAQ